MVDSMCVSKYLGAQEWHKTLALPILGHFCPERISKMHVKEVTMSTGHWKQNSEGEGGTSRELAGELVFSKGYALCYDHSILKLPSSKEAFMQSPCSSKTLVITNLAKNWNLHLLFLAILWNSSCSSVSTISCCLLYSSQFHRHGRSLWHRHGGMTCGIVTFLLF